MNRPFIFFTFAYWLFVIYGSLVPLEFKDLPLETALQKFHNIPFLDLGAESRADWIANIILYIPLAFGACASFSQFTNPAIRAVLSVAALLFSLATALGVEFTQLYFPQRTVSLNDLIAETLGSVLGLLGWQFFGAYFSKLSTQLLRGSFFSIQAAIVFYVLLYLLASLFPFDFVTSFDELDTKLAAGNDALILAWDSCSAEPLHCLARLMVEPLALVPLGYLFSCLPYLRLRFTLALILGFLLGVVIEITQLFLLSGSAQGISVLTRMGGMAVGVYLYAWTKQHDIAVLMALIKRAAYYATVPYLLVVLAINGWFSGSWLSMGEAVEKLAQTRFLPLYYFYFTTESIAFVSLLSIIGLYVPIGLLCWAFQKRPHWAYVGLLAAVFAFINEVGKLFLTEKHADPSDVWLAFLSAALVYWVIEHLPQWLAGRLQPIPSPAPTVPAQTPATQDEPLITCLATDETDKKWRIVSGLLWLVMAVNVFAYPIAPLALALVLMGYTVLLMRYPFAWLIAVPALLPIMDFAPWTGRFFFDEFDLLILATLAVYYWQKPKIKQRSLLSRTSRLLLVGFSILYTVSLLKGLLPFPDLNANAFNNYYSNYNSLRVGKGFFWSLLLLPYLQLSIRRYRYATDYFAYGILLSIAGLGLFAIYERLTFVELFDFETNYRINATFSSMHTGGGHLESYLMLSLPFIARLFVNPAQTLGKSLAGAALFILGVHTLLVTFSRGGYFGFLAGFIVLLITLAICFSKHQPAMKKSWLVLAFLAIGIAMALPVLQGGMIQDRFKVLDKDRDSRNYHWADALAMRDDDISTELFGMGLGSYPRTFFWLNTEDTRPGTYETASEPDNIFLRLRGGDALFFGQLINAEPHTSYRLVLDMRSELPQLGLSTSLCEKSIQYSLRCNGIETKTQKTGWEHIEQTIDSQDVGEPVAGGLLKRPIQLAFFNGNAAGRLIDVDNVKLLDPSGKNLLANGDFNAGSDLWFFATEKHNPWHIFNFWVHLLFDLGWLGALAFTALFANSLYTCYRRLPRQNVYNAIFLASFSGFMLVGWVDSPFDNPRLTLLFFLLIFLSLLRTPTNWIKQLL
jgi:VanZ family protein